MKYFLLLFLIIASLTATAQQEEQKLKELGLQLPPASKPIANYVKYVRTGNLLFLAGHGPTKADGTNIMGKVGKDLTVEQGYEAAKVTTLKDAVNGDLDKVKKVVQLTGIFNTKDDYTKHADLMNVASDLAVDVFGDKGKHARAAMGMVALPNNIAVEIELVVEVE